MVKHQLLKSLYKLELMKTGNFELIAIGSHQNSLFGASYHAIAEEWTSDRGWLQVAIDAASFHFPDGQYPFNCFCL
jgi:hypothetical protein